MYHFHEFISTISNGRPKFGPSAWVWGIVPAIKTLWEKYRSVGGRKGDGRWVNLYKNKFQIETKF